MSWRPSESDKRVQYLTHGDDRHAGSIGPAKGGKWQNRDTGQVFDTAREAKSNVEEIACTMHGIRV